jgi:hypothetical protein
MSSSEKIALASCLLLIVFLSTNVMLLPLLRGRGDPKKRSQGGEWNALGGLLRPPASKDQESMEELARQVQQLNRERDRPPPSAPPSSAKMGEGGEESPEGSGRSENS